jgi:hypothetical protein
LYKITTVFFENYIAVKGFKDKTVFLFIKIEMIQATQNKKDSEISRYAKHLHRLGLVPFTCNLIENNEGLKKMKQPPPWSTITRENSFDYIKNNHNCLAVKTGKISGIVVVDIDNKDDKKGITNGFLVWKKLLGKYGNINTWIDKSGNGGVHYYFKYDENTAKIRTTADVSINGVKCTIDIRNDKGIIYMPPTYYYTHDKKNIKRYTWIHEHSPSDKKLAEMPKWLYDLLIVNFTDKGKTSQKVIRNKNYEVKQIKDIDFKELKYPTKYVTDVLKTKEEQEQFKHILKGIVMHLNKERNNTYNDWIKLGMTLVKFGDLGVYLWKEFSKQCENYNEKEIHFRVSTFSLDSGLFFPTLIKWLKDDDPFYYIDLCDIRANKQIIDQFFSKDHKSFVKHKLKFENYVPKKVSDEQLKQLSHVFKLNIYKYDIKGSKYYFYYNNRICFACNSKHATEQYISISSNIEHIIMIKFKCFHSSSGSSNTSSSSCMWITRGAPKNMKFSIIKLKQWFKFDYDDVDFLFDFIPLGKRWISVYGPLDKIVNCDTIKIINKQYLDREDIYDLIINFNSIYIKSIERTNKSGSMTLLFKIGEIYGIERFIVVNPNVATLNSIRASCDAIGLEVVYYKNASRDAIRSAKVLIITMNSLHKILNDDMLIDDPSKILLWSDELSVTYNYIFSQTIDKTRKQSYTTYGMLVKFSGKCVFTDADITNSKISIVEDLRKKKSVTLINEYVNVGDRQRNLHVVNTYNWMMKRIEKSLDECENIGIVSDSKKETDKLDVRARFKMWDSLDLKWIEIFKKDLEMKKKIHINNRKYLKMCAQCNIKPTIDFEKVFSNKDVMLINSENNNKADILRKINEIIIEKDINILIVSPTLATGTNIHIKHFDRLFGIFHGRSIDSEASQQMLNRIRNLTKKNHYLFFHNYSSNKAPVEKQMYRDYINNIVERRKKVIKVDQNDIKNIEDNGLQLTIGECGQLEYKIDGFLPSICAHVKINTELSRNNFVYRTLANVTARGHHVYLNNKKIKTMVDEKEQDIAEKGVNDMIKKYCNDMKTEDFMSTPDISHDYFMVLREKMMFGELSKDEQFMIDRFVFKKRFRIIEDIDDDILRKFFEDATNDGYHDKIIRLIDYLKDEEYNEEEEATIDCLNWSKKNAINQLLKIVGFNDILDINREIEYVTTDPVVGLYNNEINKIRMLFMNDGNCGRLQGKVTKNNIVSLLSRILDYMYGIKIVIIEKKRDTRGKVRVYFAKCKIQFNNTILDYVLLKTVKNSHIVKKMVKYHSDYVFFRKDIHGVESNYNNYRKSIHRLELSQDKNLFRDLDN